MRRLWMAAVVALGGVAILWTALASRPGPSPMAPRKAPPPVAVTEPVPEPSPTSQLVREAERELLALCEERDRLLREKSRTSESRIRIEQAEIEILKHIRDGHEYLNGGNPARAVRCFERAEASISVAPKEVTGLGELLAAVRVSREKAAAALAGTPPPASAADQHYLKAAAHFERSNFEDARADCAKALQADPNHLPSRSLLREIDFLQGRRGSR